MVDFVYYSSDDVWCEQLLSLRLWDWILLSAVFDPLDVSFFFFSMLLTAAKLLNPIDHNCEV